MLALFILLNIMVTANQPILDTLAEVKTFPFITYKEAWTGTPAQSTEVAIPDVVVSYGANEKKEVMVSAAQIAYFLGQWTEDMGITPQMVKRRNIPSIVMPLEEALRSGKNIIVLGTNNRIVRDLGLDFKGPTLKVVKSKDKKMLIVGGRNAKEVLGASDLLANRIIGFKTGAYKTFLSFVKLRGLIECRNYTAALNIIKDPSGLSACGKNMSLAAPMMEKFSPQIKEIVQKRNRIMYVELPKALREKDKKRASALWMSAMFTCCQCHQGIGIERLRKFIPNPDIHSKHSQIAMSFGLECSDCHSGQTENKGY